MDVIDTPMSQQHAAGVVKVVKVEMKADGDGMSVDIGVQRFAPFTRPYGLVPPITDVPEDVRDALWAWLDSATPNLQEQT